MTDPNGININGANVEIFAQLTNSIVSVGKTSNGTFLSSPLEINNNYTVVVSTSFQTEQQSIFLFENGTFLLPFTLIRSAPSSQLLVTSVNWGSQIPGSNILTGTFTITNTGQVNIATSTLQFTSPSPLSVLGGGSFFNLGSINQNSSYKLSATFAISPIGNQSVYSVPYSLSYTDIYGRTTDQNGSFGLVYNPSPNVGYELVVSSSSYSLEHIDTGYAGVANFALIDVGPLNITSATMDFSASSSVTVVGASSLFNVGALNVGKQANLSVSFTLLSTNNQPDYTLPYAITYTDSSGATTVEKGQANFVLNSSPEVKVASINVSSTKLEPGANSQLLVNLANIGDSQAVDIGVAISGMQGVFSSNSSYVGILGSDSTASTSFGLNIPDNYTAGTYPINLDITYQDGSGRTYNSTQVDYLNVFSRGQPLVEVQNTITDPIVLYSGTNGLMTIYLTNVGSDIARNVLVQIDGGSNILASNTFTLGQINPNGTQTEVLGLNVASNANSGTYMLGLDLSYSNPLGQVFNHTSFVQLTIYKAPTIFTPINEAIMGAVAIAVVGGIIAARRYDLKI